MNTAAPSRRRFARAAAWATAALIALPLGALGATAASAVVGDPTVATTAPGTTSVAQTAGKARGSGLWGYAGDVRTRANDLVYSYGVATSPSDGSLWVTDSAKIAYGTIATLFCSTQGGVLVDNGRACYSGQSRVQRHELAATPDWAAGQYTGNGAYGTVAAGENAGVGANYAKLADSQVWDGTTMPSGKFGGVRGIAVTQAGTAWAIDSDGQAGWLGNQKKIVRMIAPGGTEAGAIGKSSWPSGNGWANRYDPETFDYAVGVARMNNGDMVVTSQTPELLKQYKPDGTFVRNIYLNQPAGTAYAGDGGFRSPYAIAVDPADGTLLVGFIDPGNGNKTFIQRVDPNSCTTEAVGNPTGSSRDRCAVTQTIGLGTLATGDGQTHATFAIQVEPRTGDIYVGQRNGLISVFAQDGTAKGKFSAFGSGTGNGQLSTVRGLAFDERGFLYATVSEGTSATRVVIFARTPDPVTQFAAQYTSPAKTSVDLTWGALPGGVTADAQAPVRDYVIEQSEDGGTTWTVVPAAASTAASRTVSGLDPAKTYQFRISAWNEAGNGDTAVATVRAPLSHPSISVTKTGNGQQIGTQASALHVAAGATVQFAYTVKNTGDVPVKIDDVTDSVLGTIPAPGGFSGTLGVGEEIVYTASGPVAKGDYHNRVTVKATEAGVPNELQPVQADWYGFGATAGLQVVKTGDGVRAATASDRHSVSTKQTVPFVYTVTNTGNVPVRIDSVKDDRLGTIAAPNGFGGTLAPGASIAYRASGKLPEGDYVNTVTVTGTATGTAAELTVDPAKDSWYGKGIADRVPPTTTPPTTPPTTSPTKQPNGGGLADTGDATAVGVLGLAGVLLLGGGVLLTVRRLRRTA